MQYSTVESKRKITLIVIAILFFLGRAEAFDDGFIASKCLNAKHFKIYYAGNMDIHKIAEQLNIDVSDEFLIGKTDFKKGSPEFELTERIDTLFRRVCDILDMQLYSFSGNIKICQDNERLNQIYSYLFDKGLTAGSFYVYDLNTIYISSENFKREILGHEIAHAVISHYFVVQPSVKIQEVLAGYIEYQLRKMER